MNIELLNSLTDRNKTSNIIGNNISPNSSFSGVGNSYQQAVELSRQFGYLGNNNPTPAYFSWWNPTCTKDMIGFCTGAGAGSVAGPWGAACGGLAYGLYASYGMMPVHNNGGGGSNTTSNTASMAVYRDGTGTSLYQTARVTLSANPYEFIGETHNAGLYSSLMNFGALNSSSLRDYYFFERNFITNAIPEFKNVYPTYEQFISMDNYLIANYNGDPIAYVYKLLMDGKISRIFYEFWVLNCTTLFMLKNVDLVRQYYSSLVDILLSARDINSNDRNLILQCISLNAYSYIFALNN